MATNYFTPNNNKKKVTPPPKHPSLPLNYLHHRHGLRRRDPDPPTTRASRFLTKCKSKVRQIRVPLPNLQPTNLMFYSLNHNYLHRILANEYQRSPPIMDPSSIQFSHSHHLLRFSRLRFYRFHYDPTQTRLLNRLLLLSRSGSFKSTV